MEFYSRPQIHHLTEEMWFSDLSVGLVGTSADCLAGLAVVWRGGW